MSCGAFADLQKAFDTDTVGKIDKRKRYGKYSINANATES